MTQAIATQSTSTPLPLPWVERLFERFAAMYGTKFLDLWRDMDVQAVKAAWAEDLAGMTVDEIKAGIDALKTKPWPPTLPEFIALCRPVLDPKVEWAEACEQMRIRLQGKGEDRWSRPQVYWAAVKIGQYDLERQPWEQIKARWIYSLDNAKADPLPEYHAPLPAPGKTTTTNDVAKQKIAEATEKSGIKNVGDGQPSTRWAVALAVRESNGEVLSQVQQDFWRGALGVKAGISAKDYLAGVEQAA